MQTGEHKQERATPLCVSLKCKGCNCTSASFYLRVVRAVVEQMLYLPGYISLPLDQLRRFESSLGDRINMDVGACMGDERFEGKRRTKGRKSRREVGMCKRMQRSLGSFLTAYDACFRSLESVFAALPSLLSGCSPSSGEDNARLVLYICVSNSAMRMNKALDGVFLCLPWPTIDQSENRTSPCQSTRGQCLTASKPSQSSRRDDSMVRRVLRKFVQHASTICPVLREGGCRRGVKLFVSMLLPADMKQHRCLLPAVHVPVHAYGCVDVSGSKLVRRSRKTPRRTISHLLGITSVPDSIRMALYPPVKTPTLPDTRNVPEIPMQPGRGSAPMQMTQTALEKESGTLQDGGSMQEVCMETSCTDISSSCVDIPKVSADGSDSLKCAQKGNTGHEQNLIWYRLRYDIPLRMVKLRT